MKKSAALGLSCSGGARTNPPGADWERNQRPAGCAPEMTRNNPRVFQYTLRLLVSSLRLAPTGLALCFAPGETLLRSGGTRPPFARDDFFTSSEERTDNTGHNQLL
ncbi:MAG: hypothetical protein ACREYE_15535 [Gammaproteobacteria bacterium]